MPTGTEDLEDFLRESPYRSMRPFLASNSTVPLRERAGTSAFPPPDTSPFEGKMAADNIFEIR